MDSFRARQKLYRNGLTAVLPQIGPSIVATEPHFRKRGDKMISSDVPKLRDGKHRSTSVGVLLLVEF